jgi:hypothetical protein
MPVQGSVVCRTDDRGQIDELPVRIFGCDLRTLPRVHFCPASRYFFLRSRLDVTRGGGSESESESESGLGSEPEARYHDSATHTAHPESYSPSRLPLSASGKAVFKIPQKGQFCELQVIM